MKKQIISIILLVTLFLLSSFSSGVSASASKIEIQPVNFQRIGVNNGEFIKGADISSYFSLKNSGVVFKDYNGKALSDSGFFMLLKECGINYIRARVWNNPFDESGKGYGGGNCDIDNAVKLGKLATDAGMSLFVDFHLSDFWCDPSVQSPPKSWSNYSLQEKCAAASGFISECLNKLKEEKIDIGMVQVGNEINSALCGESDMKNICEILKSGISAVKETDKNILTAVHYTNPEKKSFDWFASQLKAYNVEYDVFSSSYYSYWHGSTENLTAELKNIAEKYGKYVMCAETAYPFTSADSDFFANNISGEEDTLKYPVSVQGQAQALRDVFEAVANVGSHGIGVFYWEPAWITVGTQSYDENMSKWEEFGSGWESSYAGSYRDDGAIYHGGSSWDNQALFDSSGNPLESLMTFKLVSKAEKTAYMLGDADKNKKITMNDILLIQSFCAKIQAFDNVQKKSADVDNSGGVEMSDVLFIQQYLAHYKNIYGIGEILYIM